MSKRSTCSSSSLESSGKRLKNEKEKEDLIWKTSLGEELKSFVGNNLTVSEYLCNSFENDVTLPFIARYRKKETEEMKPDELRHFQEKYENLKELREKCKKIYKKAKIENRNLREIKESLVGVKDLEDLEVIEAPFKKSSASTLAGKAKALGLASLAEDILKNQFGNLFQFVDESCKGKSTIDELKISLSNIISDIIFHNCETLKKISELMEKGKLNIGSSLTKNSKDTKYRTYHNFSTSIHSIKAHQILALNRGENSKILKIKIDIPRVFDDMLTEYILQVHKRKNSSLERNEILNYSIVDGLKRLVHPFVTRRVRSELTKRAEKSSIDVFSSNLRQLLLIPPTKNQVILGIDPGFKHGCKCAVIDVDGNVLATQIIYLNMRSDALKSLSKLVSSHKITLIAIGNAKAVRETEELVSTLTRGLTSVFYTIVNEQGTSIYSCSSSAEKEFPNYDPNLISAISIARRLQDPLSEYIKIEPKHLGIGMYQHDISENKLKGSLAKILVECVSFVGVDLNFAPSHVLKHVAGLNKLTAQRIIEWRQKNGFFTSRNDLKQIKGIGKKVFEQCAGFVKIFPSSSYKMSQPLDSTLIHPESYELTNSILQKEGFSLLELGTSDLCSHFKCQSPSKYYTLTNNVQSLQLILEALSSKLDSDFRQNFEKPLFRREILRMQDLQVRQSVLRGVVRNVTHFGAFVDLGIEIYGLLHTSKMKGQSIVLGQILEVKVIHVDIKEKEVRLDLVSVSESQSHYP